MSIKSYLENIRYEREKQQRKESARKVLSGLAIGSVVGGIAGILYAPKAGKDTRQEIAGKIKDTAAATKEKVKETVQEVKEQVEDLKDKRIAIVDKTAYNTSKLEDGLHEAKEDLASVKAEVKR